MPKPYKQELPRKWNTWREKDILEFIAQTALDGTDEDEEVEAVIEAMWEELDERDYVHETFNPDEWDDSPSLDMPSYAS
jgi:hypothetical protein